MTEQDAIKAIKDGKEKIMSEELKKCPFCDGEAVKKEFHKLMDPYNFWYIECQNCYAKTGGYRVPKKAIEAWNRRSSE